jgi:hypothetical protein
VHERKLWRPVVHPGKYGNVDLRCDRGHPGMYGAASGWRDVVAPRRGRGERARLSQRRGARGAPFCTMLSVRTDPGDGNGRPHRRGISRRPLRRRC